MSDYDYDHRVANGFPYSKPAEADDAVTKAYLSLQAFKAGFDKMEEIPKDLLPFYDETMKAIDLVMRARSAVYQLRMMSRKLPR